MILRLGRSALPALLTCSLLSACAASGDEQGDAAARFDGNPTDSRISVCKAGDTQVDSSSQCLQDDAACYPINSGKWCTGERGSTCPAGSVALPAGQACPAGKRCFRIGESLECTIN